MSECRGSIRVGLTALMSASVCVGVLVSAGGCSRATKYRMNPSPEVNTLSLTQDEIDNSLTVTNDSNLRSFNRDVGYFWMMDRPSRLTPMPVGW